ncbi:MAG: alanine racemase [Deltaproteobacteria bacterium]|jgi:D-serine deaminase-like pyridoxal phosphate-dependent protein|nr:alanine racemase [Deltaproteobacteria bacterium]MBW2532362.1 alanine racemase [Deltaproteobacteria bacterium]
MTLHELITPCALVDLDRLERNAAAMTARTRALGVRLRPHVKTHKCPEAARIQTRGLDGAITVSTLAEARLFADEGFSDITWAVPLALDRLDECAELATRLARFRLLVDHPVTVAALERFAAAQGVRLEVLLEIDCGLHRSGVAPDGDGALTTARSIHASAHLTFAGILTHAGQSYRCRSRAEAAEVSRHERDVMVALADRLRAAGLVVPEVSVGSTPTVTAADDLTGITEVRPGNYLFFDAFQAAIGSCLLDEVAFSVLANVLGVYPERRELVINAGALALSRDPGPVHVDPHCGFGIPVEIANQDPMAGLQIVSLSQEHGVLRSDGPLSADWRPGSRLRILPNHSCLTAACFDRFHVVRGTDVLDEWRPVRGW